MWSVVFAINASITKRGFVRCRAHYEEGEFTFEHSGNVMLNGSNLNDFVATCLAGLERAQKGEPDRIASLESSLLSLLNPGRP